MAKITTIRHLRSDVSGRVPLASEIEEGELFINTADSHVYYKSSAGEVVRLGPIREDTETVTTAGQTTFNILANAKFLISVVINQLDYTEFCDINPPGSGQVVYDDSTGGYSTELGDAVRILFV